MEDENTTTTLKLVLVYTDVYTAIVDLFEFANATFGLF